MEDRPGSDSNPEEASTAQRVEEWLRNLRAQRAAGTAAGETPGQRPIRAGQSSPAEDPADAFLRAARRLASSPRAQQALARRLMNAQGDPEDPALRALARVLQNLGTNLTDVLASMATGGGAAVLDRPPEVVEEQERKLDDTGGGGGGDDVYDDDEGGGGGGGDGDDEEPWPSAFIGYRVGLVDALDVGNCRDGCCTAIFVDHPGLRAAVWFPTEAATEMADKLGEVLADKKTEPAALGVPPFAAGDAPARGQVQATIQFFTEDVHLDATEAESDVKQGGVARFLAYDQGLGHGGPPLVDLLINPQQARALRRALRKAAKNAPPAEQ